MLTGLVGIACVESPLQDLLNLSCHGRYQEIAMIVHSMDVGLLQQDSAYAQAYAQTAPADRSPPLRVASARPVPIGPATVTAPAIKGAAPCSISHVYNGGGGVIAECDGNPVSVAWPAAEDLSQESSGRPRDARNQARRVLLKFMDSESGADGKPSIFVSMLLGLTMLVLCLYAFNLTLRRD